MRNIYLDEHLNSFVTVDNVEAFNKEKSSAPVFCACGLGIPNMQILMSGAGYYIGDAYYDKEMNAWIPNSRESNEYWDTLEEAIEAFESGNYTVTF